MSKPKYVIVKNKLKESILTNKYGVKEKIPSESELATMFSVSVHTVRRAVNQLVNEGYLRKIQGSGTYVSDDYLNLTKSPNGNKTIGLVTTYLSEYIFPSIIRGIEKVLSEHNYSLLLSSTHNNVKNERDSLEKMLSQDIDGLIIEPTKSSLVNPNLDYYLEIMQSKKPLLMLHAGYDELSMPVIKMDDEEAGKILTEHLIELGHDRIAMISKTDDKQGKERLKGYLTAMNMHNLSFDKDYIITFETETENQVYDKIEEIFQYENEPTAFICYNDQIAIKLIHIIQNNGKKVPLDYSVVSHDDSYLSSTIPSIHLTSVIHPKEEMGEAAAKWIIDAVEKKFSPSDSIVFHPKLKIGNSTRNIKENN